MTPQLPRTATLAVLVLIMVSAAAPTVSARPIGSDGSPSTWNQISNAIGSAWNTVTSLPSWFGGGIQHVSRTAHDTASKWQRKFQNFVSGLNGDANTAKELLADPVGFITAVVTGYVAGLIGGFFGLIDGAMWGAYQAFAGAVLAGFHHVQGAIHHVGHVLSDSVLWALKTTIFDPYQHILTIILGTLPGLGAAAPIAAAIFYVVFVIAPLLMLSTFVVEVIHRSGVIASIIALLGA